MPTNSHSIAILPTAKLNFIRRIQYVVHNNCTVVPGLCAGLVCRFLPRSGHITKGSLLTSSYFLLYTLRTMCHPNPHTLQSRNSEQASPSLSLSSGCVQSVMQFWVMTITSSKGDYQKRVALFGKAFSNLSLLCSHPEVTWNLRKAGSK